MERYTRGRRHTAPRARVGRSVPRIGIVARWSVALAMSGQMDLRERFLAVPVVTRSLMASTMVAVVLNPILGLDDIVCASPHDIVRKGQIWRLALSLFYVPGLFNALIMSFVLYRLASAWEQERGSLRLAYYFFLGVVATNLGVCILAVVVAPVVPSVLSPAFLCGPGLLAAFLVLITRSSQGYAGASVNVLGLFAMPTLYFPLLLLVFFALFGANPLESAASVAVGYAWAQGYLDAVIPGDAALQAAERWPALRAVVAARGYVSTAMAGPSLPTHGAAGNVPRGGARGPNEPATVDVAQGIFARIRDHAFAGDGAGGGGGIAAGTGRRLGGGSSPGLSSFDVADVPPDVAAAAAAAPLPPNLRASADANVANLSRGTLGGSERTGGGSPNGGAATGAGAGAAEQTREERAAAFALAHERRLRQEQQRLGASEGRATNYR